MWAQLTFGIVCGTLVGFTDVLQQGISPDEEFGVSSRMCMCVEVGGFANVKVGTAQLLRDSTLIT